MIRSWALRFFIFGLFPQAIRCRWRANAANGFPNVIYTSATGPICPHMRLLFILFISRLRREQQKRGNLERDRRIGVPSFVFKICDARCLFGTVERSHHWIHSIIRVQELSLRYRWKSQVMFSSILLNMVCNLLLFFVWCLTIYLKIFIFFAKDFLKYLIHLLINFYITYHLIYLKFFQIQVWNLFLF